MYSFDEIIDRRGTGALKTDALAERYGRADLTPLWVADMDFATPDFIIDALAERLRHPILGYTVEPADWRPAIIDWARELYGVEVKAEWLSYIPGIVKGIGLAIHCFTGNDDAVVIQPPVYHPFRLVPEAIGRKIYYNPLVETSPGCYEMNLDELDEIASRPETKLLVLSSPHNPAGVVWSRDTLARVAEICDKNGVIVVSDEIHSELLLWGLRHTPFYAVSEAARRCSITFAAPTKTFNIAGVVSSYAIVPDETLRTKYFNFLKACELDEPTIFSPIAAIAAYRHGHRWREELIEYVEGNIQFVEEFCREHLPGIVAVRPQASFLVWLDCRALGLSHHRLVELFRDKAGLALNDGEMFGPQGRGFMRLNVGTPRAVLSEALSRLRDALGQK